MDTNLAKREPSEELAALFRAADRLYALWHVRCEEAGFDYGMQYRSYLVALRHVIKTCRIQFSTGAVSDADLCRKLRTFIERNTK